MQQKGKTIYVKFAFLLILLIIGAVTGPQLLFLVQDRHIQEKVTLGERDSMDISALNADYPKEIKPRLSNYAKGLEEEKNYYAYATDYEINADAYELADKILYDAEWGDFLISFQLLPEPYYSTVFKGYDIKSWKRYVICDESFEGGVTLMAWYFDIMLEEGMEIKLLVDAEDNTLYATQFENVDKFYFSYCPFDNLIVSMPSYWNYYYDAENTENNDSDNYMEIYGIENEAVDIATHDAEIIKEKNKSFEENYWSAVEKQYLNVLETGSYVVPLKYGGHQLNWEICLIENELLVNPDLYMGIQEIRKLITEFGQ